MLKPTGMLLGVNIDHIATLRQARGTVYPDPVQGALLAEEAGADGITLHLREDRRHIQEQDVLILKERLMVPMNLEMALTEEMLIFAETLQPRYVCIVPEKREELTTDGGLDVVAQPKKITKVLQRLHAVDITASLFIDPDAHQIDCAVACGATTIEIHTGHFADAVGEPAQEKELQRIQAAVAYGQKQGLIVNGGHGLHYHNVKSIAAIPGVRELNIGHSIIARAVFTGLKEAVCEMKALIAQAQDL